MISIYDHHSSICNHPFAVWAVRAGPVPVLKFLTRTRLVLLNGSCRFLLGPVRSEFTWVFFTSRRESGRADSLIWPPLAVGISEIWRSLQLQNLPVGWNNLIWFPLKVPKFSFYAWLIFKRRMLEFQYEHRTYMFASQCSGWNIGALFLMSYLEADYNIRPVSIPQSWLNDANFGTLSYQIALSNNSVNFFIAVVTYFIWQERNKRLFLKKVENWWGI